MLAALIGVLLAAGPSPERPAGGFCTISEVQNGAPAAWLSRDDAGLREEIWSRRHGLQAFCLYEGALLWVDLDPDKAAELYSLAVLRAQYDHARCRAWPANEASSMYASVRVATAGQLKASGKLTVAVIQPVAERLQRDPEVLVYEPVMLEQLCAGPDDIRPQAEWPAQAERLMQSLQSK